MDCEKLAEDQMEMQEMVGKLKKDLRIILITILGTNALWVLWTVLHHIVH